MFHLKSFELYFMFELSSLAKVISIKLVTKKVWNLVPEKYKISPTCSRSSSSLTSEMS